MAGGGDVASGERKSHAWKVVVDALVLPGGNLVGFVPDADGAIGTDAAVEGRPCRKMVRVAILGVADEMVEAAPVLRDHNSAPVDGGMRAKKAGFGIGIELAEHGSHRCGGRYPLMEGQQAIDAHADKEDDKGAFDVGGIAPWKDFAHRNSRELLCDNETSYWMTAAKEGFNVVCLDATL